MRRLLGVRKPRSSNGKQDEKREQHETTQEGRTCIYNTKTRTEIKKTRKLEKLYKRVLKRFGQTRGDLVDDARRRYDQSRQALRRLLRQEDKKLDQKHKIDWDKMRQGGWGAAWREFRRLTGRQDTNKSGTQININKLEDACTSNLQHTDQEYVRQLRSTDFGDIGKQNNPYNISSFLPGGAITAREIVKAPKE